MVTKLDQDAVASTLRKGMRLVQEMTELATEAAELLLRREAHRAVEHSLEPAASPSAPLMPKG